MSLYHTLASLQFLIIFFLLISYFHKKKGGAQYINHLNEGLVKTTLLQFQAGWITMWLSLGFLYSWWTFHWFIHCFFRSSIELEIFNKFSWAFADFFNVISTIAYFYCYHILDTESIRTEESPSRNKDFIKTMRAVIILALILLTLSVYDRFFDLTVLGKDVNKFFVLLYSFLAPIGMSLFFGRLNSHYFDSDRKLIPIFFLYAAIQAIYPFLIGEEILFILIIIVALICKILLFVEIKDLMVGGNFKTYSVNMIQRLAQERNTK